MSPTCLHLTHSHPPLSFVLSIYLGHPLDPFLSKDSINVKNVIANASPPVLLEHSIRGETDVDGKQSILTSKGPIAAFSGAKTGRSPSDKRFVEEPGSVDDIWWGDVNIKLPQESFNKNRQIAVDFLNKQDKVYVFDGFAGNDKETRIKIRIICSRPYHALFMRNMLVRPTPEELANFGEPDFTVINGGQAKADPANTEGVETTTSIAVDLSQKQMVILGTEYAGEMKKGVFTLMHYLMPKRGVLSLHSSANEGVDGDVTLFFGLSGTGKTTLSADPQRKLIGDDEHCWTENGVFNIEGGCYAKCIGLSKESDPEIFDAVRYGSILENIDFDPETRVVDFDGTSITQNTRLCYPIDFIENHKPSGVGGHPKNIIFLTCDASGVLPPVSQLTKEQAMYHFISGYTAKMPGTIVGVNEPIPNFSACFGEAFLVFHPAKYAEMLADKMTNHGANVWLINTGWCGGPWTPTGKEEWAGRRISLKDTRAIIDAIHDGSLLQSEYETVPYFNFRVPKQVKNFSNQDNLNPRAVWEDKEKYDEKIRSLASDFIENFKTYESGASADIINAGPKL
eukprot:TRINITY_DN3584_c0_g1_i3.p1 TRINITY_DN3584_c0_g1~~TRINITY_DN3584_c0_g1_i3.p1  ORF type:complete len:567 (-),score=198.64 TRINITY_DN3584_c0_g1_i3:268-1968(-)